MYQQVFKWIIDYNGKIMTQTNGCVQQGIESRLDVNNYFNQKMSETYCECKKAIYFLICHASS